MRRLLVLVWVLTLVLTACGDGADRGTEPVEPTEPADQAAESKASPGTLMVATTALGDTVVDGAGRSVYVFDNDRNGQSSCADQCAQNWPPVTVEGMPSAGEGIDEAALGTVERADGSQQVTYAGRPVYHFAGDADPGDVQGHGVGDKWWLVRPDGSPIPKAEGGAAY
jgi:predicted lipoprotein with Yx(FWY)xxD motif